MRHKFKKPRARAHNARVALLTVLTMGLVYQASAQDSELTVSNKSIGDWSVRCQTPAGGEASCVMSQTATVQSSGQRLLQVNVGKSPVGKSVAMTLVAPLGIYLPAGVSMTIDDLDPIVFEVSFCNQSGCYINQLLDKKFQKHIAEAKNIEIEMQSLDKQPIKVPVSPEGFSKALNATL